MEQMDELTDNECAWLEFLRMISLDRDPAPTLRRVQLLRRICAPRRAKGERARVPRRGMAVSRRLAGSQPSGENHDGRQRNVDEC